MDKKSKMKAWNMADDPSVIDPQLDESKRAQALSSAQLKVGDILAKQKADEADEKEQRDNQWRSSTAWGWNVGGPARPLWAKKVDKFLGYFITIMIIGTAIAMILIIASENHN